MAKEPAKATRERPCEIGVPWAILAFTLSAGGMGLVWVSLTLPLVPAAFYGSLALAGIFTLAFFFLSLMHAMQRDGDAVCWEALHHARISWQQAIGERDDQRARLFYERGQSAVEMAYRCEPNSASLRQALTQLKAEETAHWRTEMARSLGVLLALDPFSVPSVRNAIWVQSLWQGWAILAGGLAAGLAWQIINAVPLRTLIYAASGGMLGASLYNLRTLADHVAVQRDYSSRFWVDYLTRPMVGAVLGVVVYAFAIGLAWTLTLQSPVGSQMPKVVFALGFLSGYALRSVLEWLNGIAKTVFRSAPPSAQGREGTEELP